MGEVGGVGKDGSDAVRTLTGAGVLGGETGSSGDAFGAVDGDAGRDVIRAEARARPIAGRVDELILVRPALPGADEVLGGADIAGGGSGCRWVQWPRQVQRIRFGERFGEVVVQVFCGVVLQIFRAAHGRDPGRWRRR